MEDLKKFLYEEISDNIKRAIQNGTLKPGDKLKSVRHFSEELGVSNSTIFKAYFDLEGEGLIESKPKSGYYVRNSYSNRKLNKQKSTYEDNGICCISNREIIREVTQRPARNDIIELATAVPDSSLLPISKIKKSIQRSYLNDPNAATCYEETQGNTNLRSVISSLSLNWGGVFTEEDILVTNGCMEAMHICLRAITKPGDTVALESPSFYGILQLLDNLQLNVLEIPGDAKTGINIDSLKKLLHKYDVKALLLISNYNNPTGSCMPDDNKVTVVQMISEMRIPVIENDIYGDLHFSKKRPKTLKSYDKEGWVMYCSSFSKSIAPGFRIGWCIPGKFMVRVKEEKFVNNLSTSSISQAVLLDFLKTGRYELYLKRLRKKLQLQSKSYLQSITSYFPKDTNVSEPQGGLVLWIEMQKSKNALKLYREALRHKISITPGQIFSAQSDYINYIRISYGSPMNDTIDGALKTIGRLIAEI